MKSAQDYRAQARALVALADGCSSYALILRLEALAQEWRLLGDVADRQTAMRAALEAAGDTLCVDAKAPP